MAPKPHRVLLDRVSAYADEAAAYMRRRRVSRRPFARLYYAGGRASDHAADSLAGGELFVAAGRLIEVASRAGDADDRRAPREQGKEEQGKRAPG